MKIIFLPVLMFTSLHLCAQKKLSFDLSAAVLQSVGKDVSTTYTSHVNPLLTIYYSSRSKFKHPYFNVLGHISYPVSSKVGVGLQSGFYLHYREKYFSNIERTSLSIPVMATFSYKFFDINSSQLGINVAGGKNFYNIGDNQSKVKNGALYNASVFFNINKKSLIKFGVEKQIDNVSLYFIGDQPGYQNETYKYHLNRLSLILSYGLRIGK